MFFGIGNLTEMILPSEDFNPYTNWGAYWSATIITFILCIPFYSLFFYSKLILQNIRYLIYPLILTIPLYFGLVNLGEDNDQRKYFMSLIIVVIIMLFGLLGGLFQFYTDWFKKNQLKVELERKNYESNFALLRSQINPHFLFNTLHNIDTLIYDNKEAASKSIEKLSDIMRYMLNEAKTDFVDLQKEMDHLENYLSLEKLRLKNERFLNYTKSGNFQGIKVAPMIMIPFVENAFKHSVDSAIENGIILKIVIDNGFLNFYCENHFDKSETDKDKGHGIGLETVKKRLDLIYKNNYNLSINTDNSVFKVNLEINLNED